MDQRALLAAKHLADMKAPQTGEWGPLLWKILHWMSLKVGVQKSKILQDDETNSWSQLFKGLGNKVIGTALKGRDFFIVAVARGQHDERGLEVRRV